MVHGLTPAEFSRPVSISGPMSEQRYRGPQALCTADFHLEFTALSFMASQRLKSLFLNMEKCKECAFTEYLLSGSEVWLKHGEVCLILV